MATRQENKDKDKSNVKEDEKQNQAAQKNQEAEDKGSSAKAESQPDSDADEMDEKEELDSLLEVLEEEDLSALDIETATEMIDQWYEFLHGSDNAELKEVANTLKQLKKKITASKPKTPDIAEILSQLGEQIDTAADNAERGYKTKMHKLGKSLRKAGREVEKEEEE